MKSNHVWHMCYIGVLYYMGLDAQVRFSNTVKGSPTRRPTQHQQISWQARGGPGRDHDTLMELHLSKVRFRHEMYPENADVASRQVLLIQSVEIRDRLASSAINKFLYLHCTEAQPRQAYANMVCPSLSYHDRY
jgi:hypothetical protein